MRVLSRRTIRQYALENSQAATELNKWFKMVELADWNSTADILEDFAKTDYIGDNRYVFNIKGNHYRLIAMIFFPSHLVLIRGIFTHAEYSKLTKSDILRM